MQKKKKTLEEIFINALAKQFQEDLNFDFFSEEVFGDLMAEIVDYPAVKQALGNRICYIIESGGIDEEIKEQLLYKIETEIKSLGFYPEILDKIERKKES